MNKESFEIVTLSYTNTQPNILLMKHFLLSLLLSVGAISATADSFLIDETEYNYDVLCKKEVGPGVTYVRLRIPDFPLNINYMQVDLNNPYNQIETFQGQDMVGRTEALANVYDRMKAAGRKPLGGQNSNFWVVSTQAPYEDYCMGAPFGGSLKDGQIVTETNCHSNWWNGGPTRTGSVGIDTDKKLWIGEMSWKGTVKSDKWTSPSEFFQVNKYCNYGNEMALFNSYYNKTKPFQTVETYQEDGQTRYRLVEGQNTEVYLDLTEGSEWATNKDFTAVVKDVKKNASGGVLGDYDLCLTGTGDYKALLEQLEVGDVVTLNYGWTLYDGNITPNLTNLVSGNAVVMKNGELTGRNYDESYNSMVYSRSAYGMSEDGKTLFMFVIDKSVDATYGSSAGCTTSVMCQIMKQLGAWNVVNVDAGGSAQLMVQGSVVNRTTESYPRAVANGWMVYSTAPESSTISRLEFLDAELSIPVYSTYQPVILGYSEYGDLINENVENFVLSCDPKIGTVENGVFYAGGEPGSGELKVECDGVVTTTTVNVVESEVVLRISNILNDGRSYPLEVLAKTSAHDFECDPSRLTWTVEDPSVAVIENGVLRGLKNGTTSITGTIGDFNTTATVNVELPAGATEPVYRTFPAEWDLKQVGGTDLAVKQLENGFSVSYVGNGSSRGAYIQLQSPVQVWSMPKALRVKINPGNATVKKIAVSGVNALGEVLSSMAFTTEELPKNVEQTFDVDLSEWFDVEDVAVYPITLNTFRMDMGTSAKGENFTIDVPALLAVYGGDSHVEQLGVANKGLSVYPNPVTGGLARVRCNDENVAEGMAVVATLSGSVVLQQPLTFDNGDATLNVSDLLPGMYIVRLTSENGTYTGKIIINQ